MQVKSSQDLMRFINTNQQNWNNPIIIASQIANFFVSNIELSNDCLVLKLSPMTTEGVDELDTAEVQIQMPVVPAPIQRQPAPAAPQPQKQPALTRAPAPSEDIAPSRPIPAPVPRPRPPILEDIDTSTEEGRRRRRELMGDRSGPIDEETLKRLQPKPFSIPKGSTASIKVADQSSGSLIQP